MVAHESGWRYNAVGDGGDSIGLLQLHRNGLGAGLSVEQREDPIINLTTGIRSHVAYLKRYGSVEAALVSHNAGGGAVSVAGDWRLVVHHRKPDGTVVLVKTVYVDPIMATAERYRQAGGPV